MPHFDLAGLPSAESAESLLSSYCAGLRFWRSSAALVFVVDFACVLIQQAVVAEEKKWEERARDALSRTGGSHNKSWEYLSLEVNRGEER